MNRRWIALLRGINVGGRNLVPMAALRGVFQEAGCNSVRTYIQSGNVLFEKQAADRLALAEALQAAVREEFGVPAAVILRTSDEIAETVRSHPFGRDTSQTHVAFLAREPDPEAVGRLRALDVAPDRVEVSRSDAFLHLPNGVGGARLTSALLERELGVAATTRNWKTVTRLAEMAEG